MVLPSIISGSQSTYVKGRQIIDDPLIVNELISWEKKVKKKMLVFKVDFDKAFDSLNWTFLDNVFVQMGLELREEDGLKVSYIQQRP